MHFNVVDVSIPQKIESLFQDIASIEPHVYLAGGFLSDLYMNTPFKDVDFFIRYDVEKYQKIIDFFDIKEYDKAYADKASAHYFEHGLVDVRSFSYEGYNIQFIFMNFTTNPAHRFDFRFREFYYDGKHTFASQEALQDIQNKQFVFGITDKPERSMKRLNRFKERYPSFSVEPTSYERLQNYHSYEERNKNTNCSLEELEDILENPSKNSTNFLSNVFPLYPELFEYTFLNDFLSRQTVEDLLKKNDYTAEVGTITISMDFYEKQLQKFEDSLRISAKKQRIRLLHLQGPDYVKKLFSYLNEIRDESASTFREKIFPTNTENDSPMLSTILSAVLEQFYGYKQLQQTLLALINEPLHIIATNRVPLYAEFDHQDFLNNHLLLLSLYKEKELLSEAVYHIKKDTLYFLNPIPKNSITPYKLLLNQWLATEKNKKH